MAATISVLLRTGIALALVAGFSAAPGPAKAQERVERKTILQMLFGTPKRKAREAEPEVRRPRTVDRAPKRAATTTTTTAVSRQPDPVVEKLPDAKTILVVGDFIATGLGEGLVTAFETSAGLVVERRTNGSSGIVRDDYYDWPASLPGLIAETDPAIVVITLGANDRQQMTLADSKEKFRSEAWMKEYERRVAEIASLARAGGKPLFWVGMPAFQSSAMTADMTTFNTIYRTETEKAGGEFIDIWDGFVDENGRFITTGSDINGQQVRLRGSDGINLTKAGKRKLAFYVEKEIRRLLGDGASALPGGADLDPGGMAVVSPEANAEIVRTVPISLNDPALDGGSALLGGSLTTKGNGETPREKLIEKGEIADAPSGRVDDFRLPAAATP